MPIWLSVSLPLLDYTAQKALILVLSLNLTVGDKVFTVEITIAEVGENLPIHQNDNRGRGLHKFYSYNHVTMCPFILTALIWKEERLW